MTYIRRAHIRRSLAGVGLTALAMVVGFGPVPVACAQDDNSPDPPTRVGRIAVLDGNVSFHPQPSDPWDAAAVNYPIAQAGQLWVEPGGHAEVGLGEARVRLDGGSELDIVQFDDQNVVLSVPQGRADIDVLGRHPEERYVVETPRGNVDISQDGHYRIFAGSTDLPTRVAAFTGLAAIAEPQTQVTINHGEEAVIAPGDPPSFQVSPAVEDPFDHWGERPAAQAVSLHYVSPDMPGAVELDQYGGWRDDPDYGHVWVPTTVEAGWAPYHNGHWASVAPWGWTWIDDAPWGFAPFHYGRWASIGGGWGWIPGEVVVHPVYAPALVAWVGDPGALVGVGIGGVSVGWIPLGPREIWVPPYHTSIDYVRAGNSAYVSRDVVNTITVNNITVIHNNTVFVNQHNVTVVSQQAFANAQPVQHAAVPVPPGAFNHPIVASANPAKSLPPAGSGSHLGAPGHPASTPPAAPLPIAHPITPSNNLPKLGPAAPPSTAPHPGGPQLPPGAVPHPGSTPPTPAAPATPHPGEPVLPPGAVPHPGLTPPTPAAPATPHPGEPVLPPGAVPHPGLTPPTPAAPATPHPGEPVLPPGAVPHPGLTPPTPAAPATPRPGEPKLPPGAVPHPGLASPTPVSPAAPHPGEPKLPPAVPHSPAPPVAPVAPPVAKPLSPPPPPPHPADLKAPQVKAPAPQAHAPEPPPKPHPAAPPPKKEEKKN